MNSKLKFSLFFSVFCSICCFHWCYSWDQWSSASLISCGFVSFSIKKQFLFLAVYSATLFLLVTYASSTSPSPLTLVVDFLTNCITVWTRGHSITTKTDVWTFLTANQAPYLRQKKEIKRGHLLNWRRHLTNHPPSPFTGVKIQNKSTSQNTSPNF